MLCNPDLSELNRAANGCHVYIRWDNCAKDVGSSCWNKFNHPSIRGYISIITT